MKKKVQTKEAPSIQEYNEKKEEKEEPQEESAETVTVEEQQNSTEE